MFTNSAVWLTAFESVRLSGSSPGQSGQPLGHCSVTFRPEVPELALILVPTPRSGADARAKRRKRVVDSDGLRPRERLFAPSGSHTGQSAARELGHGVDDGVRQAPSRPLPTGLVSCCFI